MTNIDGIGLRFLRAIEIKLKFNFVPPSPFFSFPGYENSLFNPEFRRGLANEIIEKVFTDSERDRLAKLIKELEEKKPSLIKEASNNATNKTENLGLYTYKIFREIPPSILKLLDLIEVEEKHFSESRNFFSKMLNDLAARKHYQGSDIKKHFSKSLEELENLVNGIKKKNNSDSEQNGQNPKKGKDDTQQEEQHREKENDFPKPEKTDPENIPQPPPPSNKNHQNYELNKLKTETVAEINQVMAQEIKIADQDLPESDRGWRNLINNSNDIEYITNLKERLLVIIQQTKKEKKDDSKLSEFIKKGEETEKLAELRKMIEQIEGFRGEKTYDSLKEKISALKRKLASQDLEGYCGINYEMVKKELKNEKVKKDELDVEVQKKLEKLRKGGINQGEIEAMKDEISNEIKLKGAEKKLENFIKNFLNASPKKQKQILKQITTFINSSNSFYQKVYQKKKNYIDNLLKNNSSSSQQLLTSSKNDDFSDHVEIIFGGIVIAEVILIFFLIIKNKIKKTST